MVIANAINCGSPWVLGDVTAKKKVTTWLGMRHHWDRQEARVYAIANSLWAMVFGTTNTK